MESSFSLPPPRPSRDPAIFGAVCGLVGLAATAGVFFLWSGAVEKLNWWEPEDFAMSMLLLGLFVLPLALASLALARRCIASAYPPADDRALRSSWGVRLAGLPLLYMPVSLVIARNPEFAFGVNTPTPEVRSLRFLQLGVIAAIALIGALYGWVVPRATFRGWLRHGSAAIGGVFAFWIAWELLRGLRTVTNPELVTAAGLTAPLLLASAFAWFVSARTATPCE